MQSLWTFEQLHAGHVGGHPAAAEGGYWSFATPQGHQVAFNGRDSAVFVEANPLQGAKAFTVEALFCPGEGGPSEQRFVHVQSAANNDRVLLETRLSPDGRAWYADTFIGCGRGEMPLNDPKLTHPLGQFHTLALTFDGREMIQYVNAVRELSAPVDFWIPMDAGRVSIGARINRVWWFKGTVARVRFTDAALPPAELLVP